MSPIPWWQNVTPHADVREGRIDESLFAASLEGAVRGTAPDEYSKAEVFFRKTYLTEGLRSLLTKLLRHVAGVAAANPVATLQTSFGGGKTHTELAIYHLLEHSDESLKVDQVRELVEAAGLSRPPACRIVVMSGVDINPLGRKTGEGLHIRTMWGEMAYQLGGAAAFAMVAAHDEKLVSPGVADLTRLLDAYGPAVILMDETLHYVDKVSQLVGVSGNLADNTVAFLREMTDAVRTAPRNMMVVSLTASSLEQLSSDAMHWLDHLNQQVAREDTKHTPVERTEVHDIVRRRLFESVDEKTAARASQAYHDLYINTPGLPSSVLGDEYQRRIERSYPFHPELVDILYTRWGARAKFQLTRGTLRFLAYVLATLWKDRSDDTRVLIHPMDVPLSEVNLRAMTREVSGDPAWESVLGTDIAGTTKDQPSKARTLDLEYPTPGWPRLAEGTATTILLYSLSGGEKPHARSDELLLACTRPNLLAAQCEDSLKRLHDRLHYLYYTEATDQFRKEPNVVSLQQTHRANLQGSDEADAFIRKEVKDRFLGQVGNTGFAWFDFMPKSSEVIPESEDLKLVVLGTDYLVRQEKLGDKAKQDLLAMVEFRSAAARINLNSLVFCLADEEGMRQAQDQAREYLSWRKIQDDAGEWERIGGAQQEIVKQKLTDSTGAVRKAIPSAFSWAGVPTAIPATNGGGSKLDVSLTKLGIYIAGQTIVQRVWDRLTSKGTDQILQELGPEHMLERYGRYLWPETELWVTEDQLWQRFCRQVALPMLASRGVLKETLKAGQRLGIFALGQLADEKADRNQRDSYIGLFLKEEMPYNVPLQGQRWLVMREELYRRLLDSPVPVTAADVRPLLEPYAERGKPVEVGLLVDQVTGLHNGKVDPTSVRTAIAEALKSQHMVYSLSIDGKSLADLPVHIGEDTAGYFVLPTTGPEPPKQGRVIQVSGAITIGQLPQLFNSLLKPLNSQNPADFTISIEATVRYEKDPGSAFDATLKDSFKQEQFPKIKMVDSKEI